MPGKSIIVTGVSKGIGKSIVDRIFSLDKEAKVYGIARSEAPLKELQATYAGRFQYVVGDVTDNAKVTELVELAVKDSGKLDSLVANAGVLDPVQDVHNIDVNGWKKLYDINFFSIVSLVGIAVPHLEKTQGNVIFVSSDASDTYFSNWGAYGSSKAALNHFAMTVAKEAKGVKCLAVAPGIVDTSMQVNIRENAGKNMSKEHHEMFKSLKADNKLLTSEIPANVYSQLALKGIPEGINGSYISFDAPALKEYQF
ncbi:sepiapterin reductase family protein KNAG_0H00130 [Huiozyma naganishii CBS 8797]|uniref:Uncharacterized protein n=1 Tax=Huiozyma naganishii (strain ATCC MYA-139 / BCRC 22969 / CBS 8797 / KCTC 17520 / NBRC 10181 / NCYC 3082 / Yp74L-3) TaxID=1071383 RepID=J7S895_HUIN7|nr:hypothetical protein KNAG_0H00130 [Kazachstania naganishii CBS 8797]CCK71429.1 hypothetical protein KNAG_0H00130 [Kazachstania naganishii CBS 8797]